MNPKQTAIVLLELQNDFLSPEGRLYSLVEPVLTKFNVVKNLNTLIAGARDAGATIVHTPIEFSEDYREMGLAPYGILKVVKESGALVRDTWGAEIAPFIDKRGDDIVVDGKSSIDAFASTNLDYILRARGIRTIVLAGQLTNICIESTMRSAYDRGYDVVAVTDATSTVGLEQYRISVDNNWPMFSTPATHDKVLAQLAA
jgi:nicotinamidase-related amidase